MDVSTINPGYTGVTKNVNACPPRARIHHRDGLPGGPAGQSRRKRPIDAKKEASVNLHKLKVFMTVAQRLSITEAAHDLHLTQPAVSLQVRSLEKETGLILLERGGRKLRLTQAGELLHRCAISILNTKEEAERGLAELRDAHKGKLVLGTNTTGGMYLLPRIVRAFREDHPDTEILLHIGSTMELSEKVLQNVVDMGFVGGPTEDRRYGVEPICVDRLALIVSPSHPLARHREVNPKDLENWPCVTAGRTSRTRQFVERRLREAGVTLKIAMEMPGTEEVKKAVEANVGFAFVSGYSVEPVPKELRVLKLKNLQLSRHMEIIYPRQKYFSPVAQRFREFVHAYSRTRLQRWSPAPAGHAGKPHK
jgi:DNA-binding transcriptional LysR family regulator